MQSHKKGTSQNHKEHSVNKNVIVYMEKKISIKPEKCKQGILWILWIEFYEFNES